MATPSAGDRATESSGGGEHPPNDDVGNRYLSCLNQNSVPLLRRRAWKRLASTIAAFRHESEGRANPETLRKALPSIQRVLDCATKSLEAGDIDDGWKHLQVAQRLELLCLESAELNAVAVGMRSEADKLNPWRKTAVAELLTVANGQDQEAVRVFRAALLRDEHYNNEAYKDGIRRATALWLAVALSIGLAALLGLAWTGTLHQTLQTPPTAAGVDLINPLLGMAVTGYLGAIISAITITSGPDTPTRIPEIVYSLRVTALRLLVGPVSAIIIYFAVHSNLYSSVTDLKPDGYALLVLAFVAGFTERLVLRVVESVAGRASS